MVHVPRDIMWCPCSGSLTTLLGTTSRPVVRFRNAKGPPVSPLSIAPSFVPGSVVELEPLASCPAPLRNTGTSDWWRTLPAPGHVVELMWDVCSSWSQYDAIAAQGGVVKTMECLPTEVVEVTVTDKGSGVVS